MKTRPAYVLLSTENLRRLGDWHIPQSARREVFSDELAVCLPGSVVKCDRSVPERSERRGVFVASGIDSIGNDVRFRTWARVGEGEDLCVIWILAIDLHQAHELIHGKLLLVIWHEHQAPVHAALGHIKRSHVEPSHDTKVVGAALQPFEQIRIRLWISLDNRSISQNDLIIDDIVTGETTAPGVKGSTTTEQQAANANLALAATS